MRFHQGVAFLETEQLLELCKATDEMGFAGITVSDHIFFPKQLDSRYPYSPYEDGSPIWTPEADWPDVWCLISAMAAVTRNLRFTTSVYIAPARDLYTVAKAVSTAAVISNNRVTLGVGAGWCKEEFVATGQEFHDRGKRLDDMIAALRAVWSPGADGWSEYHGPFYDVPAMQMNPLPTEPIPIMVGGISDAAYRRMARLSDGFLATGPYSEEEALAVVARVRTALEAEGRPLGDVPDLHGGRHRGRRRLQAGRGGRCHRRALRAVDVRGTPRRARLPLPARRQAPGDRGLRNLDHRQDDLA